MGSTFTYDSNKLSAKQLKIAYETDIKKLEEQLYLIDYVIDNPYIYEDNENMLNSLREKRKNLFFKLNNLKTEYELSGL